MKRKCKKIASLVKNQFYTKARARRDECPKNVHSLNIICGRYLRTPHLRLSQLVGVLIARWRVVPDQIVADVSLCFIALNL